MKSLHPLRDRVKAREKCLRCQAVTLGLFFVGALQPGLDLAARDSNTEFDSSAKSPAATTFDPGAVLESRRRCVAGTNPAVQAGPVSGPDINAFLGAGTFYSHGYTGTNAVMACID